MGSTFDINGGERLTLEEHKMAVRRFFEEAWNGGNLDVVDEIFAPAVIFNGQSITREALRQAFAGRRVAFPDIQVTVGDQVAEGEKVSTRRTWQDTRKGPHRGVGATFKVVTWTQISAVRFLEGRIVEDWTVADELSISRQFGAVPA